MIPIPTTAEGDLDAGGAIVVDASPSVTLPPVDSGDAEDEEAGEAVAPVPTFDHLYADESVVQGIDFSTKRLLVGTDDASVFTWDTVVLGEYNGVYLLQFDTELSAQSACTYYREKVSFVDADLVIDAAADGFIGATPTDIGRSTDNPLSRVSNLIAAWQNGSRPHYDVALIDTGASGAADAVSVIGDSVEDDNGHGSRMLSAMTGISGELSVLSIKALDSSGRGTAASVYAAIQYAVACGVDVICLPVAAESRVSVSVLSRAVSRARGAGIAVVAAAGNGGASVSRYIPASISGVIVAGACDETGVRLPQSNDGASYHVVAASTSEASAKLSALIAAQGVDALDDMVNQGLIFATDYVPAEEEEPTEEPEEEPAEEPTVEEPTAEPTAELTAESAEDATEEPTPEPVEPVRYIYGDELLALAAGDSTPPSQTPVEKDNVIIQKATLRWLTASDGDTSAAGFGDLELAPEGDSVKTQQFQIDFSLSGQDVFQPGTVQIEIPAYLWTDRDGNPYGDLMLSIPQDPDTSAEFVWKRVGDKIIITNAKPISSASQVMIQGSVRNMQAHEVENGSSFDDFTAKVTVITPLGNELSMTSNSIGASLETYVDLTGASKTAYDPVNKDYSIWWESVPGEIPDELLEVLDGADPNDYVYIRWYVQGSARGNQPYEMRVSDTIENEYDGIMLGVSDSAEGTVKSEDGKSVDALLFDGYSEMARTAYVWTAYPKSAFDKLTEEEKNNLVFHNTQETTVTGIDDQEPQTTTAPAQVPSKVPTEYKFIKIWDDNDNEAGVRPTRLGLEIYDDNVSTTVPRETVMLTEEDAVPEGSDNHWTYTWTDGGKTDYNPRVKEVLYEYFGVYDDMFDAQGRNRQWQYWLSNVKYDTETHTWEYTNALQNINGDPSSIEKHVSPLFSDSTVDSTQDLALNDLKRGRDVFVPYTVTTTLASSAASVSGTEFAANPSRFTLEDDVYMLEGQLMDIEDVDIGAVAIWTPQAWKYIPESYDPETGYYGREQMTELPETILYGEIDGVYSVMARLIDGRVTVEPNSGATAEGWRVYLPNGVAKIKLEMVCDAQIVELSYEISLRVHPTEKVVGMVEEALSKADYICFRLYNRAHSSASYAGEESYTDPNTGKVWTPGDVIVGGDDNDMGYLHGRNYKVAADLQKSFEMVENDRSNQRIVLHSTITLTQQSNILTPAEYEEALAYGDIPNTTSGIYYDLLPLGVEPDISTIKLTSGDTIANVWTIENYKDSGRTMLVIMVNETNHISYSAQTDYSKEFATYPKEGYKNQHVLEFDAYCYWEVANAYAIDYMRNVVAYEADESSIGSFKDWSGEADNPDGGGHMLSGNAVGNDMEYMTGLHGGRQDPSFVYAGDDVVIEPVDSSAMASLYKEVSLPGSGVWSKGENNDVNVQEGGSYIYRLYLKAATDTRTSDIIILDSLENYVPHDIDADTDATWWRGSLVSVDVSQLRSMGIAPVVYYSTVPGLDISRDAYNPDDEIGKVREHLLNDEHNGVKDWSTTPPADMSAVTAIAIDAAKMTTGEDFYLDGNSKQNGLIIYLHMRAPYDKENENPDYFNDTDGLDHLLNAHAFNGASMDGASESEMGSTNSHITFSYTKVGIYTKYFDVYKEWDDGDDVDGKRPTEINVRLLADGQPMEPDQVITLNEGNGWHGQFDRVLTYNDDGTRIIYSFEEEFANRDDYTMTVVRQETDGSVKITLTNTHEPEKITLPVSKQWDNEYNGEGTRPQYIIVKLYANDTYTGRFLTIRPDANGNWSGEFTDLNKYYDHGKLVEYTVEEDYVGDYLTTYGEDEDGNPIVINTYHPFGDLLVRKLLQDATATAAENNTFTFSLKLETEDGQPVTGKYDYVIYDENGEIVTENKIGNGDDFELKGGQYILIKDLPTHIRYTVTEGSTRAFTQAAVVGDSGEIRTGDEPITAEFTNRYTTSGSAQVAAKKLLTAANGEDMSWPFSAYQFNFQLEDAEGNTITAYNDGEGNVTFGQLTFTNKDDGETYTYTLTEIKDGKDGYTYDETVYTVEVTPEDNGDGTMTCKVVYKDADGNELGSADFVPEFHNEYEAEGEMALRAWKTLDVDPLEDYDFAFYLYEYTPQTVDADTGELTGGSVERKQTKKNNADGTIDFDALPFDETDAGKTYYYFVREEIGDNETVRYDFSIYCYVVTVYDNGDGTLSFEQTTHNVTELMRTCDSCEGVGKVDTSGDPENPNLEACGDCEGRGFHLPAGAWSMPDTLTIPVMRNGLEDGTLTVSKYAHDGDPDKLFHFVLKVFGEGVEDDLDVEIVHDTADDLPGAYWDQWEDYPNTSSVNVDGGAKPVAAIVKDHARLIASSSGLTTVDDYAVPLAAGDEGEYYITGTSGTVDWTVYKNGTLVFEPSNNALSGTLDTMDWEAFGGQQCDPITSKTIAKVVTNVKVNGSVSLASGNNNNMFKGYTELVSVDLSGMDASEVTSLSYMFYNCGELQSIKLGGAFNTSKMTSMMYFIYDCNKLKTIDFGDQFAANDSLLAIYNCNNVERIYLGGNFFKNILSFSRMPSISTADGLFTGNWIKENTIGTANPLKSNGQTLARTNPWTGGWWVREPTGFTVFFDSGDGFGDMASQSYPAGAIFTVPDCTFDAPEGMEFDYWQLSGTMTTYRPGDTIQPANGTTITLVAMWKPERIPSVTISFNANGGIGSAPSVTLPLTESYTIPEITSIMRFGYELVGWKMLVDDVAQDDTVYKTGDVIDGSSFEDEQRITLVAEWKQIIDDGTIRNGELDFYLKGGEKATIVSLPAGTTYQLWEETEAGWVLVEQSGEAGVIRPLEESEASFYNLYRTGITMAYLSGMKTLDGKAAGNFSFTLYEVTNAGDVEKQTVQSDDSGIFKFDGLIYTGAGEHKYVIREVNRTDSTIDYDENEIEVTVVVTDDGEGNLSCTVTYETDGGVALFENRTKPGELAITKTIAPTYTTANPDFTIRVRMINKDGTPASGKTFKTRDGQELTADLNGYVTVTITGGQTVTFIELEAGMTYEIEETDLPSGWAWERAQSSGLNGSIAANETAAGNVVNAYSASGSIRLLSHKWLDGNTLTGGMFKFVLVDMNGNEEKVLSTVTNAAPDDVQSYPDDNGDDVTNGWYGSAPVIFDAIYFYAPGVYEYEIREVNGGVDKIRYDGVPVKVTVTVTDNGDGTLSASATYTKGGETIDEPEFTNAMEPGKLQVSKSLMYASPAAEDAEFTFRVVVKESDAEDAKVLNGPFTVVTSDGREFTITDTQNEVKIKGGQYFTVYDLPHGASYLVTEKDDVPGFTLMGSTGTEGSIEADETAYAEFVNLYSARGEIIIEATKRMIGGELPGGVFEFELKDANGKAVSWGTADENGLITFSPPLDFTLEDEGKEFVYRITEKQGEVPEGEDPLYYYDPHTEVIILTVKDDGEGNIIIDTLKTDDDGLVFTNVMMDSTYDLEISKTVTGAMGNLTEEFPFTLTLVSGESALPAQISYEKSGGESGAFSLDWSGSWTFTLRHGETITIKNLPEGTEFAISEAESDYVTTVTVGADATNGRAVDGVMEDDVSVSYVNRLDSVVPTGVALALSWLFPMMALALAGVLWLMLKRRQNL